MSIVVHPLKRFRINAPAVGEIGYSGGVDVYFEEFFLGEYSWKRLNWSIKLNTVKDAIEYCFVTKGLYNDY
jgi:hypothetical protein